MRLSRFWSGGNDIEAEADWVWAGSGVRLSSSLWLQNPGTSLEENCLAWTIRREGRGGGVEGGEREGCCSALPYICLVPGL